MLIERKKYQVPELETIYLTGDVITLSDNGGNIDDDPNNDELED